MNGINWNQFDFRNGIMDGTSIGGKIAVKFLKGTNFSFPTCTQAGSLENRKTFIEQIFNDICINCPKDEPLILVSLGSDRLLIEYILGYSLIENGFANLSFFLVEPAYLFSGEDNKKELEKVRKNFCSKISAAYSNKNNRPFPEESVRFLSRAQNLSKYFSENANVALIESLPPYGEAMKDFRKYKVEIKTKDLLAGGMIVPSTHANAIAFIPKTYANKYSESGVTFRALPHSVFQLGQEHFSIDWGCKIESNGNTLAHLWEKIIISFRSCSQR